MKSPMTIGHRIPLPYSIYFCPACGEAFVEGEDWQALTVLNTSMVEMMAQMLLFEAAARTEERVVRHYRDRHRVRWWLYEKLRWKRVLTL